MRWAALATLLLGGAAGAQGFTDYGQDLVPRERVTLDVAGYMRVRAEGYYDMDLDRGTLPSGQPLFPVPIDDPTSQVLTFSDMRLRTDVAAYAPGGFVAVKLRADLLDNLELGGSPELSNGTAASPTPAASLSQLPAQAIRIKRAYGEVLTPLGVLAAGRMGSDWGAGMFTNGGDCLDCDSGDAADRIAFVSPLLGHILALAYDFTASGPSLPRPNGRLIELDPSAAVRSFTLAFMKYRDPWARERRRVAGKTTFEYGGFASLRYQDQDVPAWYLPLSMPPVIDASQVVYRGFQGTAFDVWARLTGPWFHAQAEAALLLASVAQTSLVPGVLLRNPLNATQGGAILESELGAPDTGLGAGLDLGYASGDAAQYGVDDFRFATDYRIDEILFRELIGTVTNALYARPHARAVLLSSASSKLQAQVAVIASRAAYGGSTPGGTAPLGVEVDPSLTYDTKDGFHALLEYGVLFPMSGLDNPAQGLSAKPAEMMRLRLAYTF